MNWYKYFNLEPLKREEFGDDKYIFNLVPLNEEEIQKWWKHFQSCLNGEGFWNDENIFNLVPLNGE